MKLSTAILLSVIAHTVLLLIFTNVHQTQPFKQSEDSHQPIVTAQLVFTNPEPELEPTHESEQPELEREPEPELNIEQKPTTQPAQEPTIESQANSQTQPTSMPIASVQSNVETPKEKKPKQEPSQNTLPKASFDPYASLDQLINQQTNDFIKSSSKEQQQQRNNAINNIPSSITSINSKGDSPVKEIFKTAQRIDADTRVVNYNGRCVQIKRELDVNGFSQFKWTNTTLDCGLNADMKTQLKQSLNKYLKK